MSNPTLHSDILKDDGAIDAAILKLEKFGQTGVEVLSKVKKAASKMEEELVGVNAATSESRDQIGKTATSVDKLEKEYRNLEDALSDNNKKLQVLREGKKKANQIARAEAKLVLATEGSYNQLSARYSLVKVRLNEMSKAQRANTEEGKKLVIESKEIRDEMNRLQTETGNTSLSVGNYTESIKDALSQMNEFPGAAGNVVGGAKNILQQFKAIIKNPIALVLGTVVTILGVLGGAFLKTERGAKLLEKSTAVLNTTMSSLVLISDKLAASFSKTFDEGFLKGAGTVLKSIGSGLKSIFTGDLSGLAADLSLSLGELSGEISDIKKSYDDLAIATRERRIENAQLTKSLGNLQRAEAIAQVSANDTTLSYQQQLEALDDLEAAQKARLETEIKIARNNLATITQELSIRQSAGEDVLVLLDAQAAAFLELQAIETEYTVSVLEGGKLRREIRRDEFEKGLDFAIDFYDAQKRLLERQAVDENNSFEVRRAALARLVELDKSAFSEQQKLLEDFTGEKLNINQLALEEDERVVRERLKQFNLDDITLQRILETLRERKAATQDILELEEKLTNERNKQNAAPESLLGFDFGQAAEDGTANKVSEFASKALAKGRIQFFEEAEKAKAPEDIYDVLGIDFGDGGSQIKSALDFAKEQLFEFASFRTKIADQNVDNATREAESAEAALQRELSNQAAGSASRIKTAEDELEAAKGTQAKALDEQRKAQRAEQRLQAAQQATNLVTASAKIWGQLGFPLAIPALAIMWGSFIASKVRASQLTKRTNRKGTYMDLDFGGSHESGDDIPFGVSKDGKEVLTAERGEGMAVFTATARKKYGSFLPQLVKAMNRGEMETSFARSSGEGIKAASSMVTVKTGNRTMEGYLKTIATNSGRETTSTDARGNLVRDYKNERTVIMSN